MMRPGMLAISLGLGVLYVGIFSQFFVGDSFLSTRRATDWVAGSPIVRKTDVVDAMRKLERSQDWSQIQVSSFDATFEEAMDLLARGRLAGFDLFPIVQLIMSGRMPCEITRRFLDEVTWLSLDRLSDNRLRIESEPEHALVGARTILLVYDTAEPDEPSIVGRGAVELGETLLMAIDTESVESIRVFAYLDFDYDFSILNSPDETAPAGDPPSVLLRGNERYGAWLTLDPRD